MLGIKNYGRGYVFLMPGRTVLGFVPVAGYPMLRGNPEFPSGSLAKSKPITGSTTFMVSN